MSKSIFCLLFAGMLLETYIGIAQDTNYKDHAPVDEHIDVQDMPIATDRPNQTESSFLVPKGHFQIETGAWVEKDDDDAYSYTGNTFNTTLWKYGLTQHMELRLITEYVGFKRKEKATDNESSIDGFNAVTVGAKFFVCEEHGIVPKVALLTHLQVPYIGKEDFRPDHIAPSFRFLLQHTLSDRLALGYNLGAEWDGATANTTLIYTLSLAGSLVGNLSMFVEIYGFVTEQDDADGKFNGDFMSDHRFDGGFTYLLTNDLQLDVSAGVGISDIAPDYFLSGGISWRFPTLQ